MKIAEHLRQYRSACNVSADPPKFIINIGTLELQVHLLALKTLRGPDFLVDLLPWCSEYHYLHLPWIITEPCEGSIPRLYCRSF